MRAISRYVFIQLVAVTLVVTVALIFGVWLIRSLRLLDYIVNGGLPFDTFLWMVVLLPTILSVVLPISTFCAVLARPFPGYFGCRQKTPRWIRRNSHERSSAL